MASLLNMSGGSLLNKPLPQDDSFVDLGLPSGTLWAKGNIVKDAQGNYSIGNETEHGCYFSWGNIDGHNAGDGYSFDSTNYNASAGASLTGSIPSDDALHDAAVARLGNGWHMPTVVNFQELVNSGNTTRLRTTVNGVAGSLFTSVRNGNTLFLPVSGAYIDTAVIDNNYSSSWSNTRATSDSAFSIACGVGSVYANNSSKKWYGLPIRPVK